MPGSTAQRRLDEVGPAFVRLVEQRRDARLHEVARALECGHVIGGKAEPAGAIGHRPDADGDAIASVRLINCCSNWAGGSDDAYGWRRMSSAVHGGVSQA